MLKVPLGMVKAGSVLANNIYSGGRAIFRKGQKLSQSDIRAIKQTGLRSIAIEDEFLDVPKKSGMISDETREFAVNTVESVFKDFENIDSEKFVRVKTSAEMIVEEITGMDELAIHTHDLRTYDDYTYRHCVNVTAISVAIARMQRYEEPELRILAAGALMHDIGKMKISDTILKKQGKLNEAEREHIMQHPIMGFELLSKKTISSPVVWAIARQHHETLDGKGYPDERSGKQIHPWARIVSVADLWDALRSDRPYKEGWPASKVINYLNSAELSNKIDPDALETLNRIVVLYPTGGKVKLSNGMIGEVQAQNHEDRRNPVIRVTVDEHGKEIDDPNRQIIHLAEYSKLNIVESLTI